jgi:hypothetical protein
MPEGIHRSSILVLGCLMAACSKNEAPMSASEDEIPIACAIGALTEAQREREEVLLQEHLASVQEVEEREDGYSFRYPADLELFGRMAELVALEHLCCPFLDFQLEWKGSQEAPWLHVVGGARIKQFVVGTFKPSTVAVNVR